MSGKTHFPGLEGKTLCGQSPGRLARIAEGVDPTCSHCLRLRHVLAANLETAETAEEPWEVKIVQRNGKVWQKVYPSREEAEEAKTWALQQSWTIAGEARPLR